MLNNEPSFASLLKKQSPGMHYGHGWIEGKDGKRWHPSNSQADLLASLSTQKQWESWLSKLFPRLFR